MAMLRMLPPHIRPPMMGLAASGWKGQSMSVPANCSRAGNNEWELSIQTKRGYGVGVSTLIFPGAISLRVLSICHAVAPFFNHMIECHG